MRCRFALGLALALMIACKSGGPKPPAPPPDWTPPTWTVTVTRTGGTDPAVGPSAAQLEAELDRVARCWLDHWRPSGWRPPSMPSGDIHVTVELRRSCSTSCDAGGAGHAVIKSWSCTRSEWLADRTMVACLGHWASHQYSGLTGGNADHGLFGRICGV